MFLLVKGNETEAINAAAMHGIPVQKMVQSMQSSERKEVGLEVSDVWHKEVTKWYLEPGKAPHPPGTLLHYSFCKREVV